MSIVVKAPNEYVKDRFTVFLAGTIDNGDSFDWQKEAETYLDDLDIIILNPRRDDWDSSIVANSNNAPFNEQVNWELAGLALADVVLFYFAPNSKSPVSMLELGICLETQNVIIVCPEDFWRKSNIEITAKRYGVGIFESLETGLAMLRTKALWSEE